MHSDSHWRPWEIERMTPVEIMLALDGDTEKHRTPPGGTDIQLGGTQSYADWWRSLTPAQRLERARKRWS